MCKCLSFSQLKSAAESCYTRRKFDCVRPRTIIRSAGAPISKDGRDPAVRSPVLPSTASVPASEDSTDPVSELNLLLESAACFVEKMPTTVERLTPVLPFIPAAAGVSELAIRQSSEKEAAGLKTTKEALKQIQLIIKNFKEAQDIMCKPVEVVVAAELIRTSCLDGGENVTTEEQVISAAYVSCIAFISCRILYANNFLL